MRCNARMSLRLVQVAGVLFSLVLYVHIKISHRQDGAFPSRGGKTIPLLLRSRVEKSSHLPAASPNRTHVPTQCPSISATSVSRIAHVLLGLGVWPISDEHRTIRLLPHRLCVAGGKFRKRTSSRRQQSFRGERGSPRSSLRLRRTGPVVREVVSNQILWHEFSP